MPGSPRDQLSIIAVAAHRRSNGRGGLMPYVTNDGVRIHYAVEGDGPPLLLHHGFTIDLTAWYAWGYVDALKEEYRLILIDARGHGASDKPHDPAAYEMDLRS